MQQHVGAINSDNERTRRKTSAGESAVPLSIDTLHAVGFASHHSIMPRLPHLPQLLHAVDTRKARSKRLFLPERVLFLGLLRIKRNSDQECPTRIRCALCDTWRCNACCHCNFRLARLVLCDGSTRAGEDDEDCSLAASVKDSEGRLDFGSGYNRRGSCLSAPPAEAFASALSKAGDA
jgi:hypothetical protein